MISSFKDFLYEAKQLPVYHSTTPTSKNAGSVFVDMIQGNHPKKAVKMNATIIEDRGEDVYMFVGGEPVMYAYKSENGAQTEFRFINSSAVDRCNGWNIWNDRPFNVVYSNGKPYAVVGRDYNNPETLTHVELSKTKWYDEGDLASICKMV